MATGNSGSNWKRVERAASIPKLRKVEGGASVPSIRKIPTDGKPASVPETNSTPTNSPEQTKNNDGTA